MKRIITIGFLAVFATACHKDWTCTCVYPSSSFSVPYKDMPESDAEAQCNASASVDSTTYSCSISKRN